MNPRIEKILIARRTAAINRAAIDYERAMSIPAFRQAELDVRTLDYRIAMENADAEADRRRAEKIRDAVAAEYGLNTAPLFACKKCQDTGYAKGKLCDCARKLMQDDLSERMHLMGAEPLSFENIRFDSFGADAEHVKKIYGQMHKFCARFDTTQKQVIFLTGAVGTGKTHLASCILTALEAADKATLFLTAFELGNICFAHHTTFERGDLLDAVLDADFLVLDDLGTEPIYRNVTLEYLYSILSTRLNNGKKTMVTTNLSLESIFTRYGERIFSRLTNKSLSVTYEMNGTDLRLKHK